MAALRVLGLLLVVGVVMLAFESLTTSWYHKQLAEPVRFQHAADPKAAWTVEEAWRRSVFFQSRTQLNNQADEHPHWIRIPLSQAPYPDSVLLIQTRHLQSATCWQVSAGPKFYEFWSTVDDAALYTRYQAGMWRLRLNEYGLRGELLCKVQLIGPSLLRLGFLPESILNSAESFRAEKRRGFLEGSMTLLMACVVVLAVFTRSSLFLTYGAWLFFSMRLASTLDGWDHEFFGLDIPLLWVPWLRELAFGGYFLCSVWLARELFDSLSKPPWHYLLGAALVSGVGLMVASYWLSYAQFLSWYWPISLLGLFSLLLAAMQHTWRPLNLLNMCHLLVLSIATTALFMEWAGGWLGWHPHVFEINSTSVVLASSLMTAVLLAEKFRHLLLQKQRAKNRLLQAERRLVSLIRLAPCAMFISNGQGQLLLSNDEFAVAFLDARKRATQPWFSQQSLKDLFEQLHDDRNTLKREFQLKTGAQAFRWFELTVSKDTQMLTGMVLDISTRKQKELELTHAACHDELTGALNRRGLTMALDEMLSEGARQLSVLTVDVRQFSRLCTLYGLPVGDRVLQSLYHWLESRISSATCIGRLGADHFVVLSAEPQLFTDPARVRQALAQMVSFEIEGKSIATQLRTLGLVLTAVHCASDVIHAVEEAFRRAKLTTQTGQEVQGHWGVADVQNFLEQARIQRSLLLRQIPENLLMLWQPILPLDPNAEGVHAEALLRVLQGTGEPGPAQALVSACQQSGISEFLDEWVLGRVLSFLQEHAHDLQFLQKVHVNMSPQSLNNPTFRESVLVALKAGGLAASKLCIEITELGLLLDAQGVKAWTTELQRLGVSLAIDDFGAGYCNFNTAKDLVCEVIKVDGSLIAGLSHNRQSQAVVRAIVNLAHDLDCTCVAEWVEDVPTLMLVKALGVDFIQGFLLAPALLPERFFGRFNALQFAATPAIAETLANALQMSTAPELSMQSNLN